MLFQLSKGSDRALSANTLVFCAFVAVGLKWAWHYNFSIPVSPLCSCTSAHRQKYKKFKLEVLPVLWYQQRNNMLHHSQLKVHQIWIVAVLAAACLVIPTRAISAQDTINGIPIIEKLDLNALPRGHVYRFWFKAVDTNIGQSWHVPVIVNRGTKDGPRLLLNSGTQGDELNGIRVVQRVALSIDPRKLSGTIIGIPGLNTSGLLAANRNFVLSRDGGYSNELNRLMPSTENDGDAAARFVGRMWNKVWTGNADYVIDLHT